MREQQESSRRQKERSEKERLRVEQERRKEREEEDALEQVKNEIRFSSFSSNFVSRQGVLC